MEGRHGGHASLSAAGSSASALGPSSVRSTGVDVPVGAWKRIEPSSICHVYTEIPGPTSILVTSESTPLPIFSHFFTDEVWELLVLETNRFAASVCGTTPRARPWIDVSQQEMREFFGVLIYMGVCRLPRLGLYWTTNFPLDVHEVADVMSINRFQQLFRCLHLADNLPRFLLVSLDMTVCSKLEASSTYLFLSLSLNIISIRSVQLTRP